LRSVCGEWEDLLCWIRDQLSFKRTPLFRSMAATSWRPSCTILVFTLDTTIYKMFNRSLCSRMRDTFIFQMSDMSSPIVYNMDSYPYNRMYNMVHYYRRKLYFEKTVRRFSDVSKGLDLICLHFQCTEAS